MYRTFLNPRYSVEAEISAACTLAMIRTLDGQRVGQMERGTRFDECWTAYNDSGKRLESDCSIAAALRAVGRHHAERTRAAEKKRSAARLARAALWHLYRYGS